MKIQKQNPLLLALLTLTGITYTFTPAHAADATWVGNGAQAYGQAIWGGLANWNTGAAATGAGFTATFGTSFNNGYSVTVNTAQTIGTIIFNDPANANDLLLKEQTGLTLTLNNNGLSPVLNVVQSGRTLTIGSVVAGTAGFTKTGLGNLTLTNANTLSGTVVISAGAINLNHPLALQNGLLNTAASVAGGPTSGLRTTATSLTIGGLSGDKHLADLFSTTVGGFNAVTALTLNPVTGVSANFTGNIADGATGMSLTKTGAGIQTISGSSSYTGPTQINAGTLVFGSKAAKTAATAIATAAGGVGLGVHASDSGYYSATDVGNLFNSTLAGFTLDPASGVTIDTTNAGGSFDQTVALTAARALTKSGTGTLVFSQANSYTGTTTISNGTLALSGAGTLGNPTNNLILNGGALDLGTLSRNVGSVNITAAAASGNTIENGNLTGTSYVATNATGNPIIAANLQPNGSAGFAKSGAGTVTLAGTNSYTGTSAVTGGILQFAKTAALYNNTPASWTAANLKAASASTLAFNVGGTDEFTNSHVTTLLTNLGGANGGSSGGLAAGSNIGFDTTNTSSGTFTVTNLIANSSGTGGGAIGITKLGTNKLALSGVNTYTGATTVSNGTLILSGSRTAAATGGFNVGNVASATGTLNVTAGTFTVGTTGSNFLIGNGTGSTGIMNHSGGSLTTIGNQLLIGNLGGTGTYNLSAGTLTTIAGTLGVTVGVNTGSTATFNLSGGTLTMPATSTLQITRSDNSAASGVTGTFNQTGGTATVGILQMGGSNTGPTNNANNNATLNLSGGTFTVTTFNQLSGGNGSTSAINISGTANVTLPAFPTGRGAGATATLTLDGGTLKPTAASASYIGGLTSAKIKAGGAKFDVASGRDITITQGLLTDEVSTGGGLTKLGLGGLTLSGTNTYTGPTLISAGKFQLDGLAAGALTTSGLTVSSGTSLGFTAGSATTLDLTGKPVSLGGTVAFELGASGTNDAMTVGDFALTANSAFTFSLIGGIASGSSYTLLTSTNPIVTNGFTISGQTIGKLALTPTINANTITLTPTLAEGEWSLPGSGNWSVGDPAASAGNWNNYKPTVAGDAALFGPGIAGPATITVDAAHSVGYLRFDSVNPVTIGSDLSSNLTLNNGTAAALVTVNAGSHTIAENVTLASDVIAVPGSGTTLTVSGNLSGAKGVNLSGAGTLVLAGADNTYTGATIAHVGTLKLTGSRTAAAGAITVGSGATLEISNGSYALGSATLTAGLISGTSTVVQNGGSVSFTGGAQVLVGNMTGNGIYNLSTGTLTTANVANRGVILGVNDGRTGTFNLSGDGTLSMGTTSVLQIGRSENTPATGTTGIFNQSGIDSVATVGELRIGGSSAGPAANANTTGILNLTGGTFSAASFTQLSGGNNSTSVINISGTANVTLPAFPTARGTDSTATITFDGGTLKPRAASPTYMSGLTNAFIKAGGVTVDTSNGDITIAQALLTDPASPNGGFIKAGPNNLVFTGVNTYTGATRVSGGTLLMSGSSSINPSSEITIDGFDAKLNQSSSVAISPVVTLTLGTLTGLGTVNTVNVANDPGCVLSNNNGTAGASLTIGDLTFNGAATVNTFSVNNGESTAAAIATTNLATHASGIVTINPSAASWTSGTTYNLISYAGGSIGGAGFAKFALGTVTGKLVRQDATLGNSGTAITLAITGGESPTWVGDGDDKWNLASVNNWKLLTTNSYTTFLETDDVTFDDNATGTGPIVVDIDAADVPARTTVFNNSTKDYVLSSSGDFGISTGSLTKNGTGKLSISSINFYNGATAINAGLVQLTGSGKLGSASALTLGGGSLDLGTTAQTVGAVSITAAAASGDTISNGSLTGTSYTASNATGNAIISANLLASGTAGFIKSGSGTVTLAGANTFTGAINVTDGRLNLSNWGTSTLGVVTIAGATNPTLEISGSATYSIATRMFVGSTTNGTVNQTGGTLSFTASDGLLLGNGAGSSGTYNLSGGTITSFASTSRGVMLGVNPGNSGTFNLSGEGNLSLASSILMVGRSDAAAADCTTLFNQTGGTATVGTLTVGGTGAGTTNSTLTLSAGTFVANNFTKLANATNDMVVINIGGTADVTLPAFPTARGAGATTILNFDGGTLKPKAASATYLGGLTSAFIKAGGAKFDTTGFDITITQDLLAHGSSLNGGLTKTGTNKLTLNGTNTYTGDTTVSGGTLALGTINANNEASTVTIADTGATLQLSYVGTDTVSKLFIGSTQLAAGVYGKSGSVLPVIGLPQISGDGTLTVTSGPANTFANWITGTFANGTVPSGQQGPNDDPDNDGIRNLVEFAIAGQDPTVSNPSIGSFNGTLLSFTKREGTSGLSYAIQDSTDLGLGDPWAEVPAGPSYTNNGTTISYALTPGSPAKNFIRLSVTSAP